MPGLESGKVFRRMLASFLTAFRGWLLELLVSYSAEHLLQESSLIAVIFPIS